MLTEEYRCLACNHIFPSRKPMSEETCPRCGGPKLERNPWLMGTGQAACLTDEDYRHKVEVTT
jgi:putative FmdB family regulatory protein